MADKLKITSPPWEVDDRPGSDFIDIEPMVCRIERQTNDKANARAISAVPELIEALKAFVEMEDDFAAAHGWTHEIRNAQAALRKAGVIE